MLEATVDTRRSSAIVNWFGRMSPSTTTPIASRAGHDRHAEPGLGHVLEAHAIADSAYVPDQPPCLGCSLGVS